MFGGGGVGEGVAGEASRVESHCHNKITRKAKKFRPSYVSVLFNKIPQTFVFLPLSLSPYQSPLKVLLLLLRSVRGTLKINRDTCGYQGVPPFLSLTRLDTKEEEEEDFVEDEDDDDDVVQEEEEEKGIKCEFRFETTREFVVEIE